MGRKRAIPAIIILLLVLSLAAEPTIVKLISANPLPSWIIHVSSPQNDKVYPSNTVEVNFDTSQNSNSVNYSSFAYSLDGQATKLTNGSTILTGLSSGSHTLIIYATFHYAGENKTFTNDVAVIYFSTIYSTQLVVFTFVLIAVLASIGLPLFIKRRSIVMRLKGQKNDKFWLGASCLGFFTLILILWVWGSTGEYLFPHHSYGLVATLPTEVTFIIGFVVLTFITIGLILMYFGTQKSDKMPNK